MTKRTARLRLCDNAPKHSLSSTISGSLIAEQALDPWREQIADLARFPNVMCKISGLVTEADHANWTEEDLALYVTHVLAVFGPDRVAFSGDWPVSAQASTYERWVATLEHLTADLRVEDQRKLWSDNAWRFYGLPGALPPSN